MLRLYYRRSFSAALTTVLLGLWLAAGVAPCAMAATDQSAQQRHGMPGCDMERGEQAMLDCDLPESNTPVTSSPDSSFVPALLATVPATVFTVPARGVRLLPSEAARPPPLPVYLTHLALLL